MQDACIVNGRQCVTKLDPDFYGVGGIEDVALFEHLLECASLDQLHPETEPPVDTLGAIDGDHIGMAYPGEQAAFLDD